MGLAVSTAATAGSAALAVAGAAHAGPIVECETVGVIVSGEEAGRIRKATGEFACGDEVCAVAREIDAGTFADPTPVEVLMPSGAACDVRLRWR